MENNIYYFLVFIGSVIFCIEIAFLLKKPFLKLSISAVKQVDIILDLSLNERKKDRLLLTQSVQLLTDFFIVIFLTFLVLVIAIIPVYIFLKSKPDYTLDSSSLFFYMSMFSGSFVLLLFKKKSDYSYWSKLLHTIILSNYNLGKYLFNKEVKLIDEKSVKNQNSFVMITGLARAGTTALANLLYNMNRCFTLNIPFYKLCQYAFFVGTKFLEKNSPAKII